MRTGTAAAIFLLGLASLPGCSFRPTRAELAGEYRLAAESGVEILRLHEDGSLEQDFQGIDMKRQTVQAKWSYDNESGILSLLNVVEFVDVNGNPGEKKQVTVLASMGGVFRRTDIPKNPDADIYYRRVN